MLPKYFVMLLLLVCYATPVSAHDAFYPHHRDDFENMARRRELRTTVLLSTAAFLCVLGAVVYMALRRSTDNSDVDEVDLKTVQEHLEHATQSAVYAARQVLDTEGDIAEVVTVCFATYSEMFGVTWRPPSYRQDRPKSVPYQIRCTIGADVLTLNIDSEVVQLKVERSPSKIGVSPQAAAKSLSATAVLRRFSGGEE